MSTYTRKFCPHCRHFYQSYSTATKDMTVKKGCPIVYCTKCGEPFLDKDIKEPAFSSPPPAELNVFKMVVGLLYPFGIGGIFFLILGIAYKSIPAAVISLIPFAFYAYLLYVGIKNKKEISDEINIAYTKSKARLADKDYVIQLIDLGYYVPKSFLREHHPELVDYQKGNNHDFFAKVSEIAENKEAYTNGESAPAPDLCECEMCGCVCLKTTYAKIEDDMGTRYRHLCWSCVKTYNATPIEKND